MEKNVFYKNIKVRLYPTVKQKKVLDSHFDGYRFCYNLCLEYTYFMWKHYKINKSGIDLQNELFAIRNETAWLRVCKSECIREAGLNVHKSMISMFNGSGFPKFKSRKGEQSFYAHQTIRIINNKLSFFGNLINFKSSQNYINELISHKIKTVTFKRDTCGNYFACCLIESESQRPHDLLNNTIGIDLGIKDLLITSDGVKYDNNNYLRSTSFKIANLQRKFSRTQKGSSNRNKLRIKIAKLYRKAIRQREYYYHQITNKLIRDNQTIVLETLKIKNMVRNPNLARSIHDANWGSIIKMLEYKANWSGRTIIRLDTFYPSTKTCSNCGSIKDMPLTERIYNCKCGLSLDRDINAAINIRNAGLKIPGVPVEGVGYEPIESGSNRLIINN